MRKRYNLKKRLPNLMFIHALPLNMRFGIEEDMFKAFVPFLGWRIPKENALVGSRSKFATIVRIHMNECRATKYFEW